MFISQQIVQIKLRWVTFLLPFRLFLIILEEETEERSWKVFIVMRKNKHGVTEHACLSKQRK